jgi:hypothetical protein
MLPSLRNYLRFIDLDSQFDSYRFTKKVSDQCYVYSQAHNGYPDRRRI